MQFLAAPLYGQIDRLFLGPLQVVDDGFERMHSLTIQGDDPVVFLDARLGCRKSGLDPADHDGIFGKPPCRSHLVRSDSLRNNRLVKYLAPALDGNRQRLIRAEPDMRFQLFPRRVLDAVDLYDPVAGLQSSLRGGRPRLYSVEQ